MSPVLAQPQEDSSLWDVEDFRMSAVWSRRKTEPAPSVLPNSDERALLCMARSATATDAHSSATPPA